MVVGRWWHSHNLRSWSTVNFGKLKDHFRGRCSSPWLPSLLQGSDLLKGDTLRGWRLRVGGGRLGLVSTWRAARTRTGTSRRASVQDNTTWKSREGPKLSAQAQTSRELKCWAIICFHLSLLGRLLQTQTQNPDLVGTTEIWSDEQFRKEKKKKKERKKSDSLRNNNSDRDIFVQSFQFLIW